MIYTVGPPEANQPIAIYGSRTDHRLPWSVAGGLRPAKFHEQVGEPGCRRRAGQHRKPAEAGYGQNWPPHSAGALSPLSLLVRIRQPTDNKKRLSVPLTRRISCGS